MLTAHIHHGSVVTDEAVPTEWEGLPVKVLPLSPDDPVGDLEERLAILEKLGPMEWELGEREMVATARAEMNQLSRV
jgi:hypothetical protein